MKGKKKKGAITYVPKPWSTHYHLHMEHEQPQLQSHSKWAYTYWVNIKTGI